MPSKNIHADVNHFHAKASEPGISTQFIIRTGAKPADSNDVNVTTTFFSKIKYIERFSNFFTSKFYDELVQKIS